LGVNTHTQTEKNKNIHTQTEKYKNTPTQTEKHTHPNRKTPKKLSEEEKHNAFREGKTGNNIHLRQSESNIDS
jgi:hypothetical protein